MRDVVEKLDTFARFGNSHVVDEVQLCVVGPLTLIYILRPSDSLHRECASSQLLALGRF